MKSLTPAIYVSSEGKQMNPKYEIFSIDICNEANKVPWAELVFLDGDAAKRSFPISESGDFGLGKKISISLGYVEEAGSTKAVFEGHVFRHEVEMNEHGQILRIECRHKAFMMTRQEHSTTFEKMDDKAILEKLGQRNGNINFQKFPPKGPVHAEMVQYHCSDWDFMLSRCAANGWLVVPDGKHLSILSIEKAKGSETTATTMDFNVNEIFSLQLSLNAEAQFGSVVAGDYNFGEKPHAANVTPKANAYAGKVKGTETPQLAKGQKRALISPTIMEEPELKAWANAETQFNDAQFYRGRFELQGRSDILVGKTCKIEGIGPNFDGKTIITAVRHRLSPMGWYCDVQVGISPDIFPRVESQQRPKPASGLVPGTTGLQVGKVVAFEAGKQKDFRVKVNLSMMNSPADKKEDSFVWARLAMPTVGGDGKEPTGMIFWPDLGDEVVVGFFNDDPRSAVILGNLFNAKRKPPFPFEEKKNAKKGLVTKSGSKLEFDDDLCTITLGTKEKLTVLMDEKKQSLTITETEKKACFKLDKTGISMEIGESKFVLDEKGITMQAKGGEIQLLEKSISLTAKKKLNLEGKSGALLNGNKKVDITASAIELK